MKRVSRNPSRTHPLPRKNEYTDPMDPFSELTLYRRVAIQDVDTFKEDWKILKREFSDQMNDSAVAPNEPKAGEPAPDKGCLKSGKRKAGTNPDSVKAAAKKTAKT